MGKLAAAVELFVTITVIAFFGYAVLATAVLDLIA